MKTYIYKGDGAGIPGLAQQITEDEARALPEGLAKQFQAALDAGVYVDSSLAQGGPLRGDTITIVGETPRQFESRQRKTKAGASPEGE